MYPPEEASGDDQPRDLTRAAAQPVAERERAPHQKPGRLPCVPIGSCVRVCCSAEVEGGDAWAQRFADVDETVGDRG
jgi:hypothetical protein